MGGTVAAVPLRGWEYGMKTVCRPASSLPRSKAPHGRKGPIWPLTSVWGGRPVSGRICARRGIGALGAGCTVPHHSPLSGKTGTRRARCTPSHPL